jgi:hypothetical protein
MFYSAISSSLWRSLAVSYRRGAYEYINRKPTDKMRKYSDKYALPVAEFIHGFADCDLEDGEGKVAVMGRHLLVHPTSSGYVCVCVYVCLYVCMHVCMYVCVCMYLYMLVFIHNTHTHTTQHTRTRSHFQKGTIV